MSPAADWRVAKLMHAGRLFKLQEPSCPGRACVRVPGACATVRELGTAQHPRWVTRTRRSMPALLMLRSTSRSAWLAGRGRTRPTLARSRARICRLAFRDLCTHTARPRRSLHWLHGHRHQRSAFVASFNLYASSGWSWEHHHDWAGSRRMCGVRLRATCQSINFLPNGSPSHFCREAHAHCQHAGEVPLGTRGYHGGPVLPPRRVRVR